MTKTGAGHAWARPVLASDSSPSNIKICKASRVFLCLLISLLWLCPGGLSQQDVIVEIAVHGQRRIPAETVKARIFTRPGDVYDAAALERDFNSLWNTGYFEDIRFEREQTPKGWRIHVYVKERPTISEIEYVGLNSVSKSDVLDRFKDRKVGLSPESQYDPTKVKKAEVTIRELLSEHGRQFATVRTEVRPIPPAKVSVTFVVKEGPKVSVGKITFVGNRHVNSRILRGAMKNLKPIGIPHSIFLENIFAKTYDATKLDEDTERVRAEFQNRGYFKVLVQDPKTEIHDTGHPGFHIPLLTKGQGKAVDITIPIDEGEQYRLGSITFNGNKEVSNVKALRSLFPMKDGDIFSREKVAKGLDNLRDAYRQLGHINFTSIPNTTFDENKKLVNLTIDIDEGKKFYVRRIEFAGNTTTRDKVIRREVALEEGQVYDERLWKLSLLRLNQLGYFEPLKPEDPNVTETHLDEKNGTVDLTLKVRERGKNSIGLNGGVSGLAGAFIGINYSTNNFLGLGETLSVQASIGNSQRILSFGFTEPYLFDRPIQGGFTVFTQKYNYNQARQEAILTGQQINLPSTFLNNLQNYTQSSSGFTGTLSYQLHRSFKRVGLTYSFDRSSIVAVSDASKILFTDLAFRGISGPNSLEGIITSKILPSFSFSTIDSPISPKRGTSLFLGGEIAGLGGTVRSVRPIVQYKHFKPMQKGRNTIGFNVQGSFLAGYGGVVAPPFERFYLGGENDIRGFDIRSVSPVAFLPDKSSNRFTIAGPVALAPFVDVGMNPIIRNSQLRINPGQLADINTTVFGCPALDIALNCAGGHLQNPQFSQNLQIVSSTNWVPRMSTGLEVQVFLPVINAPFRVYWAYNPLRLDTLTRGPVPITRDMFPPGAAGDFTFEQAARSLAPEFQLREPRKTFRFSVATTF